jgi:hypothetical protein
MPGLVPGIYVLKSAAARKDLDGRDKPGHDERKREDVCRGMTAH